MKRTIQLAGALIVTISMGASNALAASGTVDFKNFSGFPALNAPVFDVDGSTLLSSSFTVSLFAGPSSDSLSLIATTPISDSSPGYFFGGPQTIDSVTAGATAFVQIRAWETAAGSFDNALVRGESTLFSTVTGGAGDPASNPAIFTASNDPQFATGLQSFSVVVVPEPSTMVLGLLGGLGLLWRRRK